MTLRFQHALKKLRSRSSEGSLLRATSFMMLIQPLGLALSFGLSILLARSMSTESLGIYFFVLSFLQVFGVFGELGFKTSLLRFVPTYLNARDWPMLKGLLNRSNQMIALSCFVIALAASLIVYFQQTQLTLEFSRAFWLAMLSLPLLVLMQTRSVTLRAFKRVAQAALPESIIKPLLFGLMIALGLWFYKQELSATQVFFFSLIATGFTYLMVELWYKQAAPKQLAHTVATTNSKFWIKVSIPLFAVTALLFLMKRIDSIMLGMLTDTTQVALFGAASRISDLARFGLTAVNMIAAPMISGLYHSSKHDELQRVVRLSAQAIFVITLVLSLGLSLGGPLLLSFFGSNFQLAFVPLLILMIGQAVSALSGSVGFLMSLTGHHNQAALFVIGVLVLNVGLNFLLIPRFGMNGAAVATSASFIIWNLAALFYVLKNLNINPTILRRFW